MKAKASLSSESRIQQDRGGDVGGGGWQAFC